MFFKYYTLASKQTGLVSVTVSAPDGRLLGKTHFTYFDDKQSLYLAMWSQEHGSFESDGNLDPFTLQDQGKTKGLV